MVSCNPDLVASKPFLDVMPMIREGSESTGIVIGTASNSVRELSPGNKGLDSLGIPVTTTVGSFVGTGYEQSGGSAEY